MYRKNCREHDYLFPFAPVIFNNPTINPLLIILNNEENSPPL